jgi:glycosyltransferase involved in cell wall biosynthesis
MTPTAPYISVIIPTHNRARRLCQTLDALCQQDYLLAEVEVLVVADGCSDDTVDVLAHYQAPFALQVIQQIAQGPAAARNAGAACTRGRYLLFLDDDIQAAPMLIQAHLAAHRQQPGGVVIGHLPPVVSHPPGFFRLALEGWWENMFDTMREPGHRFAYTDLLSGNFSLSAQLFQSVGGFDASYTCHEDYELGVRLLQAGVAFSFAPEAIGYHHEASDLTRALSRKYQEGLADVQLGQRYPELRPTFLMSRLYYYSLLPSRIARFFVFHWPFVGDFLIRLAQSSLGFWEATRLRTTWYRVMDGLLGYWYWRGVAQALKGSCELRDFVEAVPDVPDQAPELELDLSLGIDVAEWELDHVRPASARVRWGIHPIGHIRPQPGVERLKGSHLRWLLANMSSVQLLRVMALEGALTMPVNVGRLVAIADRQLE